MSDANKPMTPSECADAAERILGRTADVSRDCRPNLAIAYALLGLLRAEIERTDNARSLAKSIVL